MFQIIHIQIQIPTRASEIKHRGRCVGPGCNREGQTGLASGAYKKCAGRRIGEGGGYLGKISKTLAHFPHYGHF